MYPSFCLIQDIQTVRIIGRGTEKGGLYYVDEVIQQGIATLAHEAATRQILLWHRRLAHTSSGYLDRIFPALSKLNKNFSCETCILAKSHRQSFLPSNSRIDNPFLLVHTDVWGPIPETGSNAFTYFFLIY